MERERSVSAPEQAPDNGDGQSTNQAPHEQWDSALDYPKNRDRMKRALELEREAEENGVVHGP